MSKQLRVLLVEDSEDDAVLLARELQKGGYKTVVERVDTPDAMRKALNKQTWDIVISDYIMPKFSGLDALKVLQSTGSDLPFIIVSGKIGEDTAVEVMRNGAHDYIMKSNLNRLNPAIERELHDAEVRRERKEVKEDLKKSYADLEKANKSLEEEVIERKKAENEAVLVKEHLQNVIDSATELIFSLDQNKRITTWNKTAEQLTGYKQKEILNRSINKLPVFDNSQQVLDLIKSINEEHRPKHADTSILTKTNAKKILRITGSSLEVKGKPESGILLIGRDITRDIEMHGKLLAGNSYIIPDKNNTSAIDLFSDLTTSGYNGLFITRSNPEMIKSMGIPSSTQVALLSQEQFTGSQSISEIEDLVNTVKQFNKKNKNSVILLDGAHYVLTRFSFEKFVEALFQIDDIISKQNAILLLRIDPSLVNTHQMAIIENELKLLPSQKIEGLIIEDDVLDVLKYIHEQNQNNVMVSFKKIMNNFKIAYSTAAKRLEILEEKGLIFTKRQGKLRTVYVSEKGKTLIHKRQTA